MGRISGRTVKREPDRVKAGGGGSAEDGPGAKRLKDWSRLLRRIPLSIR